MDPRIKKIFIGCYAATFGFVMIAGILGVIVESHDRASGEMVRTCMTLPAIVTMIGWFGTALWWVYDAWSSIPEEHRNAPIGGAVSPGAAVAFFFVPCLNVVWMFLINYAIADSINRALEARGSAERCSMPLAMTASAFHLLPYCNLLIGPVLWFFWMRSADRARAQLAGFDTSVADVFS